MIGLNLALIVITFVEYKLLYIHCAGTTPHIKDVFIGRCWQYQNDKERSKITVLKENVDCEKLWNAFSGSFAYKDECHMNIDSYKSFFSMLNNTKKITNSLFWSGSGELVHDFTFINDEYIVLEDTMTGYLLNGLTWCGHTNKSTNGINYDSCTSSGQKCNAMYFAWYHASAMFAGRASGQSTVLLNASRSGNKNAYHPTSFFRSVEMPRLKVDSLHVLVASNIGEPIRERCGEKSLLELEADAKRQNIQTTCKDQPKLVLRVFCLKFPRASQCKQNLYSNTELTNDEDDDAVLWRTVSFILIALTAILFLFIGACLVKSFIFERKANLKYAHNWSFSKKPMICNTDDDYQGENNNVMV